jgi:uncharacterized membrane protein
VRARRIAGPALTVPVTTSTVDGKGRDWRSPALWATAILFVGAGLLHFVAPGRYIGIVPRQLPFPAALVAISGACEIGGGLGLLVPQVRGAAGIGLIALLIAVFPANIQMLLDARTEGAVGWMQLVLWLRLPLQPLLMGWIWRITRRRGGA